MQYTVPDYYTKFKCSGSGCPDTCCAGWQIQIDPASLKKYRKAKGMLAARLKNEINWKEGCFRQYHGRCAFLNEDNLCDLYLEGGGEKAFCRTCRTYPRHIEEFEGLREISLSMSCPTAAELILDRKDAVRFLHHETNTEDEDYGSFDFFLFTKLMDARSLIFRILQDRSHPLFLRTSIVLSLSHDLQERIRKNALYDIDPLLERYTGKTVWNWFENRMEKIRTDPEFSAKRSKIRARLFHIFSRLELLRSDWEPFLNEARRFYSGNPEKDNAMEQNRTFTSVYSDVIEEQILIYFIFTYFCGAVYNENAYGKMKFSVAGAVMIRELTRYKALHSPEMFGIGTIIKTACRYSREVEHSDFNKITLEKILSDESVFPLKDFLILI